MLDPFDYKEPACALCGGEAFYNFDPKKPQGHIPVDAVIRKLDDCLACENYAEGARVLRYWIEDAKALNDRRGELSVQNEVLGLSRRIGDKPWGLAAVERCLQLIAEIGGEGLLSTATILLNAATTCKAFDQPERALPLYDKAKAVYEKELDKNDLRFAALYNNLATTLTALSRFDEAEKNYRAALCILEQNPDTAPDRAVTLVNLADLYAAKEAPETEIENLLLSAFALLEDPETVHDEEYAFVCRKLSEAYGYYGFFKQAKRLTERADAFYAGA